MNATAPARRSVAVIGGGITGLAAAHRLHELQPDLHITLLETGSQLGGVLQTEKVDGYLIEHSADNFITNIPWALELCCRVGLNDQLLPTNPAGRRASVVHNGRLYPIPDGFMLMAPGRLGPILRTPILSARGKLRLACEYFIPPRHVDSDESLASFARRRLGHEAFERLIQPLVGGIYTADPERLSVRAALPRFVEMEAQYGSLIRGTINEARRAQDASTAESGARYGLFTAPRDGMTSLVQALATRLPDHAVRLNTTVESLEHRRSLGWHLTLRERSAKNIESTLVADALIIAVPASRAAALLSNVDDSLAIELREIPYAGCSIVVLAYHRNQFSQPPAGFGFVVPDCERRGILACSYASQKYPGRAPDDTILLRVFVGGAQQLQWQQASDAELFEMVERELADLLGVRGSPRLQRIRRWNGVMPQYHVGHVQRVERIFARVNRWPTLALAGNAYQGVGVPQCIHSGEQAAERTHAALNITHPSI